MRTTKTALFVSYFALATSCTCEDNNKSDITTKKENITTQEIPKDYSSQNKVIAKKNPLTDEIIKIKDLYVKADTKCKTQIDSTDRMKFMKNGKQIKNLLINKKCKKFYLHLKHTGKLSSLIMGHNILITKSSDMNTIVAESIKAGKENQYVPTSDKVLAGSHVLLGGDAKDNKEDYIEIDTTKFSKSDNYKFFCSFPGHSAMMQGDIIVK